MQKNIIPLRNIQAPAAGTTCVIDVPVASPGKGRRYHEIIIEHSYATGNQTIAGTALTSSTTPAVNSIAAAALNIAEIRLVANGGQVIRRLTGTELRDLNLLSGTPYDFVGLPNTSPGVAMTLHFAEPWRQQPDRDALSLATAWKNGALSNLQLQIDLSTGTSPTIVAHAVYDEALPDTQPGFLKIIRTDITAQGSVCEFKLDPLGILNQVSLYPDTTGANQATKVTLRIGDRIVREVTKSALAAHLLGNGMFPQASGRNSATTTGKITDIVLDHDDFLKSGEDLRGGPSPIITVEATGLTMAGTIRAIIQRLDLI